MQPCSEKAPRKSKRKATSATQELEKENLALENEKLKEEILKLKVEQEKNILETEVLKLKRTLLSFQVSNFSANDIDNVQH